jgi:hypothetical protein
MKKNILLAALILSVNAFSQIHNPVKWTTAVSKISDTEYDLIATATIQKNWHLYSQNVPEGGPIATKFTFDTSSKKFKLIGNTTEDNGYEVDDKVFVMRIKYFESKAVFKQRIKLSSTKKMSIIGTVKFMVCDDANCLPPTEQDLNFSL